MSALSGLDVRLRISAETCSLVLRTVSRQSLASLLGSMRPRIPLSCPSTCQCFLLQLEGEDDSTHTLPAEDMWSTPANTIFSGLWSISGSTESLLPVMTL